MMDALIIIYIIVIAYNTIDRDKWIYPKSPTNPICTRDGWKHLEHLCRTGVVGAKLPQQTCLGVGDTTITPHLVGVGEVLKMSVLMVSISILKVLLFLPLSIISIGNTISRQITPNTR